MSVYDPNLFVDRDAETRAFEKLLDPNVPYTGMLIRGPAKMGKTCLLGRLSDYLQKNARNRPAVTLDFRNRRERLQMDGGLGLMRLMRDKLGCPEYFTNFNLAVARYTAAGAGPPIRALQNLADRLEVAYDKVEGLMRLARWVDVDPQNLPHDVKQALAYALVRDQYGKDPQLRNLMAKLNEERPQQQAEWLACLAEITGDASQREPVQGLDSGAPLAARSERERLQAESDISNVFFQCLATLLVEKQLMVLFIDHYDDDDDEVGQDARAWIKEALLPALSQPGLRKLVVIMCGRTSLPDPDALGIGGLVRLRDLEGWSPEFVRQYWFEKRRVPLDEGEDPQELLKFLSKTTGGKPGAVEEAALQVLRTVRKGGDPLFDEP